MDKERKAMSACAATTIAGAATLDRLLALLSVKVLAAKGGEK